MEAGLQHHICIFFIMYLYMYLQYNSNFRGLKFSQIKMFNTVLVFQNCFKKVNLICRQQRSL